VDGLLHYGTQDSNSSYYQAAWKAVRLEVFKSVPLDSNARGPLWVSKRSQVKETLRAIQFNLAQVSINFSSCLLIGADH